MDNIWNKPLDYNDLEAKLEASRCLSCKKPMCQTGCPTGMRIRDFILEINKELNPADFDERVVLDELMPIGDSIALVKDDNLIKVHIHTLVPGNVLNIGQKYGEFIKLKIENMTIQHHENQ